MGKKTPLEKPEGKKGAVAQFFKVYVNIILELYREYRLMTIGILLLSMVTLGVGFIELKFLEYVTNSVSAYMGGALTSFGNIAIAIGLFLLTLLVVKILSGIYNLLVQKYQSQIMFKVEKKIVSKLSAISYEYYEDNAFYEKINLARQASEQYANAVYSVTQLVNIVTMLVVYGWMLSRISLWFVGFLFLSIIICSVIAASVTDKQLDYWCSHVSPEERSRYYFMNVFANRVNHQNIQTGRTISYFTEKFQYFNRRERKNYLKLNLFSMSTELATSLLFLVTFFITAITVGKGVASGEYEIGYFTMVIALLTNLFVTIKSFAMFLMNENWYVKVLDAYYEVMNLRKDIKKEQIPLDSEYAIELKELRYRYTSAENCALNGVNLNFKKGEKIALVGENGSGKTTLISVLLGLLDRYEGIYGQTQTVFTSVLQDFGQYQMTVKENIEIGCGGKSLTEKVIDDILKKVGLYDFIASKPDGIHTKLGQLEEGVELSKGQWQRLAIGRLLANQEANVWILDEPTAYVDPLAEIDMYKLIFDLAGDRLVLFISHRLGFAKTADRILVVAHGTIAEQGTHQSLLAKTGGCYAQMYNAQKEWYV